ncbi:DNA alkylation repair protein [Ammoniphilus oxalaticus]|uniref:DNA alkylation repair protein n=1 Tax=Ammoniphilus oxalaticus TaxID=66863 RepID=A0A419SMS8_9BACL|nr:DNA alkylation repair protein [Ammoniphilus oxalaticus]RKD25511.1 DNA alkylation repair protein [Ammoniphilus oxalaticus]
MTQAFFCPNCKTNRTRFNLIEQVSKSVKVDPATGAIVETYEQHIKDPFHAPYRGPSHKVQCATCGVISDEELFIKAAQNYPRGEI